MTVRILLVTLALLVLGIAPASADENLGQAGKLTYVRDSSTIEGSPSEAGSAVVDAKCPKGSHPISGGASIRAGVDRTLASTTIGTARKWYADAWQTGTLDSKMSTYAVCSKSKKITNATHFFAAPQGPSTATGFSECDGGKVIGGGLLVIGNSTEWKLNASFPIDGTDQDADPDDGWKVFAEYLNPAATGSMVVRSVCLKGAQPTYVSKTVDVDAGEAVTVRAKCPKGSVVAGGGAYITGATADGHVVATRPYDSADKGKVPEDGWEAGLQNTGASVLSASSHAVCLPA